MNADSPDTRQIEPELLERLGLFVVRWSFVEKCVSDLFVLLTKGDPGSMIVVTSSISTSTITDWIRALIETHQKTPHDLFNEINDVLAEVDHLRSERNILIHGLWSTDGPANSVVVQTVRLGRNEIIRGRVVTESDLGVLIDDSLDVTRRLLWLTGNMKPIV